MINAITNTTTNSSFWLDDNFLNDDIDVLTGNKTTDNTSRLIRLAGYRRAIANFVRLVTDKDIPVRFQVRGDSYTDGESVMIAANLNDKDFDSAVGLALHEGSHIKLTNFDTLKFLINDHIGIPKHLVEMIRAKYAHLGNAKPVSDYLVKDYIVGYVRNLLNIIEDRRIDNFIFTSAPGYKGYYHALYNKYFNDKAIDKGLVSNELRELDWRSYMFRICNITNENRDLNALPGFMDIWNTIDLANIGRLNSTEEALDLAFKIFELVENNIPKPLVQDEDDSTQDGDTKEDTECDGEGASCSSPTGTEQGETPQGDAPSDDGSKAEGDLPTLSDSMLKRLNKAIEKQEAFMNGEVNKKSITKKEQHKLKQVEESGSEIANAGKDYSYAGNSSYHTGGGTDVIIIKNFNSSFIESGQASNIVSSHLYKIMDNQNSINNGMRLGHILGRKLQVRAEERNTKYTRLDSGKIDKRLLASLGFGAERIFTQTSTDKYNPANVHISIDASGSMNGIKFENTQTAAVAIAKAASMISNINVQISYRTTQNGIPLILIAYDSRKDKISKIRNLFKHITVGGLTPEGLCFEAIKDLMVEGTSNMDSYFINFSDGEPYCYPKSGFYYAGEGAIRHTGKRIKEIKKMGIKVLSYFIHNGSTANDSLDNFKRMYGRDAENVNVTQVLQLTKTLNKMFLNK